MIRGDGLTTADMAYAAGELKRAIKMVRAVLPDLKTTRFHQTADYYTLVLLLHRYRAEGYTVTAHDRARNGLAGALLRDFGL